MGGKDDNDKNVYKIAGAEKEDIHEGEGWKSTLLLGVVCACVQAKHTSGSLSDGQKQ